MNETEQRELDAWIAENVMGWDLGESKPGHGWPWFGEFGFGDEQEKIPHYTTDPAAAMEVLKKCSEETYITTRRHKRCWSMSGSNGMTIEAETLELAICLFAKKLFSKQFEKIKFLA